MDDRWDPNDALRTVSGFARQNFDGSEPSCRADSYDSELDEEYQNDAGYDHGD